MIDKAIERTPSSDQDDIKDKYNEKFKTKEGVTVDYNSAISLVNQYCASLPKDMFTNLAPDWSYTKDENGDFCVSLLLPIQSPLKYKITVSWNCHCEFIMRPDPNTLATLYACVKCSRSNGY